MILDKRAVMEAEAFQVPYKTDKIDAKKVLIVAPHCDDEIFGCGGTIAEFVKNNIYVKTVVVSKDKNFDIRKKESLCAKETLNYNDIDFWDFKDGYIFEDIKTLQKKIFNELKKGFDTLFAPSVWEMHRDHLSCAIAAVNAANEYKNNIKIIFYEIGFPLIPNLLTDITSVFEVKKRAMGCFVSQQKRQNYIEQIIGLNSYRTYTLPKKCKYAEAFRIEDKKSAYELIQSINADKFLLALKKAENELYSMHERLKELDKINGELFQIKQKTEKKNTELQQEIYKLLNSKSWKLTKPLRVINRMIKREVSVYSGFKELIPSFIKVYIRKVILKIKSFFEQMLHSKINKSASSYLLRNRKSYIEKMPLSFKSYLKDKNFIEIDLTLVTYNSSKWLKRYFETLANQEYPLSLINIFIVDNGSSDDTLEKLNLIKRETGYRFKKFEIIESINSGFGSGHNRAAKMGNAAYILVSNPDIEFNKKSISSIVSVAKNDAKDVASWELRQLPYEHPKHYDPVSLECSWSSHACILIKREAFEKLGGYDERIFLYGEDVEFSYRARSNGWKLRYIPFATINHYSYSKKNEIKPSQYIGSTVANIFLRLRYGLFADKLTTFFLIAAGCLREPFKEARKLFCKDIKNRVLPYSLQLIKEQKRDSIKNVTPFRGFDYELKREGAFYEMKECKEKPLVSIITRTVRGRAFLLLQAAYSVFNQTYNNIEWIVIEDGGDSAKELIEKLKSKTDIKIVYKGLEKVGRSAAGNTGLEIAGGDFVMFLDDDDLLYSDHVETLVCTLKENKDASAAYSLAWAIESKTENGKIIEGEYIKIKEHEIDFDFDILKERNFIPIQSILFKKELFLERGGFDTSLEYLEDWNLWQRYGHNSRFIYVPKTTSLYRIPMDMEIRVSRQKKFDEAYNRAKVFK